MEGSSFVRHVISWGGGVTCVLGLLFVLGYNQKGVLNTPTHPRNPKRGEVRPNLGSSTRLNRGKKQLDRESEKDAKEV